METATFAGGCFWCTEGIFQRVKGVESVVSGYAGGAMEDPEYENVTSGRTGHAECIQITFDPNVISYEKILEIFFATHDPTTLNKQGYDVGTQYRSIIFYHNEKQKKAADLMIMKLNESGNYPSKIVTEVVPFVHFYKAEEYHQNFYNRNQDQPYCQIIIDPKIRKLLKEFKENVKEPA